jgi:hypothetical protein
MSLSKRRGSATAGIASYFGDRHQDLYIGEVNVVISDTVIREMENCDEQKRKSLNDFLNEIAYTIVQVNEQVTGIAERFVSLTILRGGLCP